MNTKTLLVINSSGRVTRSITRRLTARFTEAWLAQNPEGRVIQRDLTLQPLPTVNEGWIASSFANPADRTPAMTEALRTSETIIEELIAADAIVFGAPIYNFGMPAQLKAFFDQIVRVGRTFDFTGDPENPYRPLLPEKPVVVVVSAGDGGMHPGGPTAHLNFFEPHLALILGFLGFVDQTFVRVGYEESKEDPRFQQSLTAAEAALDEWVATRSTESVEALA